MKRLTKAILFTLLMVIFLYAIGYLLEEISFDYWWHGATYTVLCLGMCVSLAFAIINYVKYYNQIN